LHHLLGGQRGGIGCRVVLAERSRPTTAGLDGLSAEAALAELDAFEIGEWGKKFPTVVASWRRVWDKVIPFFAFPPEVRRVIYTTNAIESVNARLRKILKTRGHFPNDAAATKLIWLALRNITADWGRAANHWKAAMNQFAILYEERFTQVA
jgi:putative transposase